MTAMPAPQATEALAAPAAGTAAVTPPLPAGTATPELGASVLQMLFGLAVVIALLFACLWLIRRLSAPRGGGAAIKVLGAAAVGPRERVVLVELGEQVLVLGVAPGSVSPLLAGDGMTLCLDADVLTIAPSLYCGFGRPDRTLEIAPGELVEMLGEVKVGEFSKE